MRRQDRIIGVTTAATLWFTTIVGLCLGGGHIGLGLAALGLGLVVLWCFRWIERALSRERIGTLTLTVSGGTSVEGELRECLAGENAQLISWAQRASGEERTLRCEVRWKGSAKDTGAPVFLSRLARRSDLIAFDWTESRNTEA